MWWPAGNCCRFSSLAGSSFFEGQTKLF